MYISILHHFQDTATQWLNSIIFFVSAVPSKCNPIKSSAQGFVSKNRVRGLVSWY